MREVKEWTLMFYFASDNPLAPSIVSQLKAIKDAGFHPQANVVARFDPHTQDTPSHIFDVNQINKFRANGKPQIGFASNDPFVRSLVLDKLWGDKDEKIRGRIQDALKHTRSRANGKHANDKDAGHREFAPPKPDPELLGEQTPVDGLRSFLDFCCREYPARHYMLFILGHGVVVGNDLFLFDEHTPTPPPPDPAITEAAPRKRGDGNGAKEASSRKNEGTAPAQRSLSLKDLGNELLTFKQHIAKAKEPGKLEMIGFHSCSMSGLEVAYQLQDTAHYMLASQGPAFVGSWPYRQILIRLFNDLGKEESVVSKKEWTEEAVKELCTKIFYYCLYNSHDFQLAGYSFDVCLSDLTKIHDIKERLINLTTALKAALKGAKDPQAQDPLTQDLILLAHWDAQSYWQESYVDLYDFCFRLNKRCDEHLKWTSGETAAILGDIGKYSMEIMKFLKRGVKGDDNGLVVRAEFSGPSYQYSHGFSIFFPWSLPADGFFSEFYGDYQFSETHWRDFLREYFDATRRDPHRTEAEKDPNEIIVRAVAQGVESILGDITIAALENITSNIFNESGQLNEATLGEGKKGSLDPLGGGCDCPSIKNYPSITRDGEKTGDDAQPKLTSPNFFNSFQEKFD
jgi:hypothetical protein